MSIERQILFFFSFLGAFNGILLCIYFLFIKKPRTNANIYLGLLLAALSIRIGKSTFLFFNHGLAKSYLQFGLTACFAIGPALLLYVLASQEKKINWLYKTGMGIIFLLFLIHGFMYTYDNYPEYWQRKVFWVIYNQWAIFIILAGIAMKDTFSKALKRTTLSKSEFLRINVFIGVSLIWLAYYTSSFTSYIVGAISFSFILYLSIILFYFRKRKDQPSAEKKEKYADKKIPFGEANEILTNIQQLMNNEKAFADSTINLTKLAKKLNVSPHLLSQLLNDNLQKNFSQFINEYRIDEAKKMLVEDQHLKIQAVAENCGFNSNSTFYAAFKKITGTTPAEFIKTA
ncbi:helix-turn-helix domain-containing protein [Saprospiraceae bacterium]|nr:helix-turn-helix domain-containing protein [Saprospiraceae bacterium]